MPNWGRFSASTTYNKTNATKRFLAKDCWPWPQWLLFCGYDRSPPIGHGHPQGHAAFPVASMGRGESKALQFALLVDPF